jgi:hypothetical protein
VNLVISTNDNRCPFGQPVSLVDLDTMEILGCYKYVEDAQHEKSLRENRGVSTSPTVAW